MLTISIGSGKSHTVSVLLEGMLIPEVSAIGTLKKPLAGLVFHYGEGGSSARPCEAAYLAQPTKAMGNIQTPNVTVYVSPTAFSAMRAVYEPLGSKVVVKPLKFSENELDAQSFRSLMAVSNTATIPLYMQVVLVSSRYLFGAFPIGLCSAQSILREMGDTFTYSVFREKLKVKETDFSDQQLNPLKQRLALLESFISTETSPGRFEDRGLTIIDLSDPFIDSNLAASLFEIIAKLFVRVELGTGKVLLVDEAHKVRVPFAVFPRFVSDYLQYLGGGKMHGLTNTLLRLIREQRHLGLRVIISTQGKLFHRPSSSSMI